MTDHIVDAADANAILVAAGARLRDLMLAQRRTTVALPDAIHEARRAA